MSNDLDDALPFGEQGHWSSGKLPLMKCGHVANGTDGKGNYVCVICSGLNPGAVVVADKPDLTGRVAKCSDCGYEIESNMQLPFFEYRPTRKFDVYYCGCKGWE